MSGLKCSPGCQCKRHQNKGAKCKPECTCSKHDWSVERRRARSENQVKLWEDSSYREKLVEAHRAYEFTEEHRRSLSEAQMGHEVSEETRKKISEFNRGKRLNGQAAVGFTFRKGYLFLTGQQDHPLAHADGTLAEHRKVLYDVIGPGPHQCYWCERTLEWVEGIEGICVDHLDRDISNNDPANLAPSCHKCNWDRSKWWFRPNKERSSL